MPSRADFELWLNHSIAGPPTQASGEQWINFTVRFAQTNKIIGRLEANIHEQLTEVAFLYDPSLWGHGYASQGLIWLHDHLRQRCGIHSLWAATHPNNLRCATLLRNCGYEQVQNQDLPVLYSFDEGDFVFKLDAAG
jgi:RimJ/RimL family protein N-acetyltransferase